MFNRNQRISLLKSLAQTAAPASTTGTATATTPATTAQPVQTINITALPGFRTNLFSNRSDIIQNLNAIVNAINKNMLALSNNVVNFNIVWQQPSVTGSEYSNTMKSLVNIAKWLYSTMKIDAKAYSIAGLQQIANYLINLARSSSFPDATNLQAQLITMAQLMLAKLGPA